MGYRNRRDRGNRHGREEKEHQGSVSVSETVPERHAEHKKTQAAGAVNRKRVIPDVEVPGISEPRPVCSICGEPVEAIIEAVREPDGSFSHFDCVLERIARRYNVREPDKVSYIGHGTFAVVGFDEENRFYIKERVEYESAQSNLELKKFVEESRV